MKVNHFRQMMRYLTRPPDNQKGKFVKVRKPNAVPPKTNTIKLAPLTPINFDLIPKPYVRDPESEAAEKRYLEIVRKNEEEKFRNANSGLAGLMGGYPNK